jgi:plastocyanin
MTVVSFDHMTQKTLLALIIVVLVIIAGYFIFHSAPATVQNTAPTVNTTTSDMGSTSGMMASTTTTTTTSTSTTGIKATVSVGTTPTTIVTLTSTGFSPATVTIHTGQSVTFVDKTTSPMDVASDPHPTHEGYSGTTRAAHCPDTAGTAFDQCAPGNSYTFTFQKIGSWGYHNHFSASEKGTVVVAK